MDLPRFDNADPDSVAGALEAIIRTHREHQGANQPLEYDAEAEDLQALIDAAVIHEMHDQLAHYVEAIANDLATGHPGAWVGDQPVGAAAALALARRDLRFLTFFAEFLSVIDIARFKAAGEKLEQLMDIYGLIPESMYLVMLWSAGIRAPDGPAVFAEICRRHLVLEWLEEHGQRLEFIKIIAADQAAADLERGVPPLPADKFELKPQTLAANGFRGAMNVKLYVDALCNENADMLRAMREVAHEHYLTELSEGLAGGD